MSSGILDHIDDTLHAKARLAIMTVLIMENTVSFSRLKQATGLTDGNLGAHVHTLEEAGYLERQKSFVRNRPHTTCTVTPQGRQAFREYVAAIEDILRAAADSLPE